MANRLDNMIQALERLKGMKVSRKNVENFVGWMELVTSSYFPERQSLFDAIVQFDNGKIYSRKAEVGRRTALEEYYKGKSAELKRDVQIAKQVIRKTIKTLKHIKATP